MLPNKTVCTGCGVCAASCPVKCIKMIEDSEGFRYPKVDSGMCIFCKKCEAVCPVCKQTNSTDILSAYAVKHKDDRVRKESSSGAFFPMLASHILELGGVVCGAAYTMDYGVEHLLIDTQTTIKKLQGAKYAQSKAEHLFETIKVILESGRLVLFSGTPCQVAAMRSYLNNGYENLILVDMICHGVPSPLVWRKYIEHRRITDADGAKIISINQRDKSSGWSRYGYSINISFENGKVYCVPQNKDMFMLGFVNNLYLRPSCSVCHFKGANHSADITLGDYWGVWDQYPEFDDNKGVSLVLINSEKGQQYWDTLQDQLLQFPVNADEALKCNPSANESSCPHQKRDGFFALLNHYEIDDLIKNMLWENNSIKSRLKQYCQRIFRL